MLPFLQRHRGSVCCVSHTHTLQPCSVGREPIGWKDKHETLFRYLHKTSRRSNSNRNHPDTQHWAAGSGQTLLSKASLIKCPIRARRLTCLVFILLLLRLKAPSWFSHTWVRLLAESLHVFTRHLVRRYFQDKLSCSAMAPICMRVIQCMFWKKNTLRINTDYSRISLESFSCLRLQK